MLSGERDAFILSLLEQQGMITVAQIASRCDCALETARRDLRRLETKGLLTRTYGGGIRPEALQLLMTPNNGNGILGARTTLIDRADVLIVTPSDTSATRMLADRARRVGVP